MSNTDHCTRRSFKDGTCHLKQCSKCLEYYLGFPEKGHQCYREMRVDNDFCFDPVTQSECHRDPHYLQPGHAVFFAVLPNFMNVDIRIVLDVTVGITDVYLTPEPKMFVVETNKSTWEHEVLLDSNYHLIENTHLLHQSDGTDEIGVEMGTRRKKRSKRAHIRTLLPQLASNYSVKQKTYRMINKQVDQELTTFVEMQDKLSVLHVTGLQNRLVISLPEERHDLRTTRFFLLVKSNQSEAFGYVYFRQDQLHIDLFVFFSVFFSCFFLFLSACVVLWKIKNYADRRRAIARHHIELQHMARRPFARATVDLSARPDAFQAYVAGKEVKKRASRFLHNSVQDSSNSVKMTESLRAVALEPLISNKIAVATVLVQMPNCSLDQTLTFGCVLIPEPSD